MTETYTKLFSTIVTSTIWQEDKDTKILWITMLAIADFDGKVDGSIPGIANIAGLSTGECRAAMSKLMAPDPDSRTQDNEGRRVAEIDGGWIILNYEKYRNKGQSRKDYYREYMREYRTKKDVNNVNNLSTSSKPKLTDTETDTETDTDIKKDINPLPPLLNTPEFQKAWDEWEQYRTETKKKLTPTTRKKQLKMLSGLSVGNAIKTLENSITNGWQGLFPERAKNETPQRNSNPGLSQFR